MSVSNEDVKYVATLARLELNEEESAELQDDLNRILVYFEKLNELNTSDVVPTAHVIDVKNKFRDDCVIPSIERELALKNAKETKNGYFKVPRIIE